MTITIMFLLLEAQASNCNRIFSLKYLVEWPKMAEE